MASGVLCQGNVAKYAWINLHQDEFNISLMCKCLEVSWSSYYEWRNGHLSSLETNNKSLSEKIATIFNANRKSYGTRRIKRALANEGIVVSRRRIGRLMSLMGLFCKTKRKFKVTTDSKHTLPVAENLLDRKFTTDRLNKCYVGDITYIHTQEGWMYLAVVIDLFSRNVVGWSIANHMKTELVNNALLMAIWKRKPGAGLLWHTDRGMQAMLIE